MTTTINSNGSKWAGEAPDTIDDLLKALASNPLHWGFDGNLIYPLENMPGTTRFCGNFLTVSHVFCIDTDEPDVIKKLTAAIRVNQQRPDYLDQPDPVKASAKRVAAQCLKLMDQPNRGLGPSNGG